MEFVKKHKELFTILGLCILFYFIFFFNIGNYALMDVDETRYAAMARDMFNTKDFFTLYLNGDYFFEKPPLYFWGECLSFLIFGKVNEFSVRFPVALYGTLLSFAVYFLGKAVVSRKFGVLSALILATSLEFVILSKFAILDIAVAVCIGFSLCFGFFTYFCKEKNKKYFWWLFYLFSGLAVLAKGIPGFVIPFGTMFFTSLAAKKFKEIFKPQYCIIGAILFLLVVLPWHILMFKLHNPLFFNEYIIKHHLERFVNSNEIGRKQPFYFFILTFLWGFFPWIFSFVASLIAKIKSIKLYDFNSLSNEGKLVYLNAIAFLFTMLFFSSSSTKLITYLLPIYTFSAFLGGYIWNNFEQYKKPLKISSYILGVIFVITAIAGLLTPVFLPKEIYTDILSAKWLCIIVAGVSGILCLIFTLKNKFYGVFAVLVGFMLVMSAFGTKEFFNIDYKFGQNDLIEFAKYAKENNYDIDAINLERKYSLLYYRGAKIDYENAVTLDNNRELIVIKTKDLDKYTKGLKFEVVKTGKRYSLIK